MPKEIDPEVQALLDENPATLPPELVKEGWGHFKMAQTADWGIEPKTPGKVQAPTYDEVCVQCQRPIARGHRGWMDHRGSNHCPADMLDEPRVADHHIPQADYDLLTAMRDAQIEWNKQRKDLITKSKTKAKEEANATVHGPQVKCSATKHSHNHSHQCFHPTGHFGFHECRECRALWS